MADPINPRRSGPDLWLRTIAERDGKLLVEVLEEALEAYENSRNRQAVR